MTPDPHKQILSNDPFDEVRKYLESSPGSVYIREGSRTLLHTAVIAGNFEAVGYLVSKHPELLESAEKKGYTPLHIIGETQPGDTRYAGTLASQLAPILLSAGAPLERKNSLGRTPLLSISIRANMHPDWLKCLTTLLEAGANPNAPDNDGRTYLHYIAQEAEVWAPLCIVELLLRSGARLDIRDVNGQTPLDICRTTDTPCDHDDLDTLLALLGEKP